MVRFEFSFKHSHLVSPGESVFATSAQKDSNDQLLFQEKQLVVFVWRRLDPRLLSVNLIRSLIRRTNFQDN